MTMKNSEKRSFKEKELRVARSESGPVVIEGYAIVYDSWTDIGWFDEMVVRGAASNALKNSDVRALIDHDPSLIVGREGVNLTLTEDERGVFMRLTEPSVKSARFDQLAADVEAGLITGQSYAFTAKEDRWTARADEDREKREILEIGELFDVSLVTYPAYPDTTAAKRSRDTAISEERYQKNGATPEYDEELELLTIITAEGK